MVYKRWPNHTDTLGEDHKNVNKVNRSSGVRIKVSTSNELIFRNKDLDLVIVKDVEFFSVGKQ